MDMAASPERRRPRRGSIERPVNARLYRGTWLLVALPLLLAAFSVGRPGVLPRSSLPPAFDTTTARELAQELSDNYPNRAPGTSGALNAATWVREQLGSFGLQVTDDAFEADIPGVGKARLHNLAAVVPGPSPAVVVLAHRDDPGTSAGANDNASGTGALIELARLYATPSAVGGSGAPVSTAHRIIFLSTDGGAFGGIGAVHFLERSPYRADIAAAINLDSIGGQGSPRIELAGDEPRSPAASFVATATARLREQTGETPGRVSALGQLVDLAFPFSLYEQAPFVARGIPAVTLTAAGSRPPGAVLDRELDEQTIGFIGTASQQLLASLDQGLELTQGTTSYVFLGDRIVRGWALEIVLLGMLLPFVVTAVDLYARCRRRRVPLTSAAGALRSRILFWLFAAGLLFAFSRLGAFPGGDGRPPNPDTSAAGDWAVTALTAFVVLLFLAWFVPRERLLPRRAATAEEELAGHTAALLALAVVSLLVASTNPFALIFVLPSLHAWVWLPHVHDRSPLLRLATFAAGLAGPALLLWSFGSRFGLGLDAPWYVLELFSLGYVRPAVLPIAALWLAVAGQLLALAARRYGAYPEAFDRRRLGPLRRLVRGVLIAVLGRRASAERRRAFGG
jgi:hypothetical protein